MKMVFCKMAIIEWIMAELNLRPDDGRARVKISR